MGNRRVAGPMIVALLATLVMSQGCAILNTGHMIDRSKIQNIKLGETKGEEVRRMFGKPDFIIKKYKDGVSVWGYKSNTNVAAGLPIPFFMIMKGRTTGLQLNVVINDETDTVLDYELSDFDESLTGRGK